MSLSAEERVKIRYHLGYLQVQQSATFVLGIPAAVQTQFMVEPAMDKVLLDAEPELRRHLSILDRIDNQMIDDLELLAVDQVDEIKVRGTEQKELWQQYDRWRHSLANILGIIPNPYDQRLNSAGVGGINARVIH